MGFGKPGHGLGFLSAAREEDDGRGERRVQAAFKAVIWMVFLCLDRLDSLCYTQDTSSMTYVEILFHLPSYFLHQILVLVAFAAIVRGALGEGLGGDG